MMRFVVRAIMATVVVWATAALAEPNTRAPLRSFSRFQLDAGTIEGVWGELGAGFLKDESGSIDVETTTGQVRLAYGTEGLEAGVFLPYAHRNTEIAGHDSNDNSIGDLELYGKGMVIRTEAFTAGLGLVVSLPTGQEEEGLGAGRAGFIPFGTLALTVRDVRLQGHFGYQTFANDDKAVFPESFVYGVSAHARLSDAVAVRAELVGNSDEQPGENRDRVSFEPGVDIVLPLGPAAIIVRPTGSVGLTDAAPDWGVGGSVVLVPSGA